MKAPTNESVWYNNSDAMIDYFDIAYYIKINAGRYDKPYEYSPS